MMDEFDRLLEQTSLGTPGAKELIDAVPDRVVERTLAVARAERARLDELIVERLGVGVRAVQAVAVSASAPSIARSPSELDIHLNLALDAPAVGHGGYRGELRDLASLAADGDQAAREALLIRVRSVAHRYVRARLWTLPGGADLVDDVAQEVAVAVFDALGRYRDEGRPFEAFVYGIAARKVADAQRASAVADKGEPRESDQTPTPDVHAIRHSEVQQIMSLVDKLPERLREILRLRVVSGMSAEEVGRALGMTPGAVRVAQHRALNTLRGYVDREPS